MFLLLVRVPLTTACLQENPHSSSLGAFESEAQEVKRIPSAEAFILISMIIVFSGIKISINNVKLKELNTDSMQGIW